MKATIDTCQGQCFYNEWKKDIALAKPCVVLLFFVCGLWNRPFDFHTPVVSTRGPNITTANLHGLDPTINDVGGMTFTGDYVHDLGDNSMRGLVLRTLEGKRKAIATTSIILIQHRAW
ncbi:hypothetical protein BY458DRAFT_488794 [Sporodiniella umbellata]|nr:hypothetical protein BY458DRAFT_488794 [Sporodiniella umbellata]